MASKRQLALTIIGNAKGAVDALKMTEATATKFGKSLAKVSAGAGIAFAAVGAAAGFAAKQVLDGALASLNAAAEDQKSQKMLAQQIRETTYATAEQIATNEEFITQLQFASAVADTELRPALANLVRGTGNLTDAQRLLTIALDISAATGKDLGSVTQALGRAATGNVGALTRLGIPLDENAKKTKNFNLLVEELAKTFRGASAAGVNTFAGRVAQLRIAFDETVESIGYALMPMAERLVDFIAKYIVPALQTFSANLGERGVGEASRMAVAAMGEMGAKGVNAIEGITLATLVATRKIVDMAEKVLFIATILNMLTGNAAAFAKTWTAGFSADRVKAGIDDALKTLPGMFDDFRKGVNSASASLALQAEEAQELARRGIKNNEVTREGTGLQGAYGGAVGGTARQINKAEEALKEYTRSLDSSNNAKKRAADASKSVLRADKEVATAYEELEKARRRFTQITQGFGAGSKQAIAGEKGVAQAKRSVERATYGVEQAVFAVADAEKALAELRTDPEASAQAIREAEIALAEAKLSVVDATDAQENSTAALARAERDLEIAVNGVKEGTDEYAEALAELRAAEERHLSAIEAVTDARKAEAEAIKAVKEAEEELAKARGALPKGTQIDEATGQVIPRERYGSFMEAVRALHPNSAALKSSTPVAAAKKQFPRLYEEYKAAGLALAKGGIVTQPTQALIGEAGAEAVIPLDRLQSGMNIHVTINAGMGADAAVIGDEIVNTLQRWNRRNGALPLKVA